MRVQVVPPSRDTNTPLPGPPLIIAHGCISTCHVPAKIMRGFFASIDKPLQPVFSSTKSTRSHFCPPSVVRKTPRSCCGAVRRPTAQTKTISGFVG
jgi:hypothetical protein